MDLRSKLGVLLQPSGSRNQESQHIQLSVLMAAVLVPPKGVTVIGKHQWGDAVVGLYFIFLESVPCPLIAKSSLYKKAISGGITIPDFKLYYRATVLKTAWYWHKNRHVDQWNRIEDPDINPHKYENLIFDKDAKTVTWKKESIFNKWCWRNWMSTCRRLQIDPYLSPCTKLKSKWIKDLIINPVTLNLIKEKVGSTVDRIGTGDQFLNITPIAQTLSATINQCDYMKLRSFCRAKDKITKTKCQPTELEKIFTNPTSDRGLISRIYKELKKHDIKTPDSPIEKWAIELNREFMTEDYRMAERHLRTCSTPLLIRETQIKTTLRYHLTPVRMAKIKNTEDSSCWRGCGARGTLLHCWWECRLVQSLWKAVWRILRQSRPSHTTLWHIHKEYPVIQQGHMLNYVHSSIICNSQNLETA
ncbi:hypothetical protein STEG23_001042 [Scotinomys teguina]